MDLRVFTEPQQGATYDDLLGVARTAEDAGYDAFFRSDHDLPGVLSSLPAADGRSGGAQGRFSDHFPREEAGAEPTAG